MGAADPNVQRNNPKKRATFPAAQEVTQRKTVVTLPPTLDFSAIDVPVTARELYDNTRILLLKDIKDQRAINVAVEAVKTAVALLRNGNQGDSPSYLRQLEIARGYSFPSRFHVRVADMIMKSDINYADMVDTTPSTQGQGNGRSANGNGKTNGNGANVEPGFEDLHNSLKRVETAIAMMLEELAAHGVITLDQVRDVFAPGSPFAKFVADQYVGDDEAALRVVSTFSKKMGSFTDEVSRFTRIPIRQYDPVDGRLTPEQIEDNKIQNQKTRRMFLNSPRRGRVIWAKTVRAAVELACIDKIQATDPSASEDELHTIRYRVARNFEDVYLQFARALESQKEGSEEGFIKVSKKHRPYVKEKKPGAIQREMEDRLLKFFDPEAAKTIRHMCEYMASKEVMTATYHRIVKTLDQAGFHLGEDYELEYRAKRPYSVFSKLLEKIRLKGSKQGEPIAYSKLGKIIDFWPLGDLAGFKLNVYKVAIQRPNGEVVENEEETYRRVRDMWRALTKDRKANGCFVHKAPFSIWEKRDKNYVKNKKIKKPDYRAINITCVDAGEPQTKKQVQKDQLPPRRVEIQLSAWEDLNKATHALHKERGVKKNGDGLAPNALLFDDRDAKYVALYKDLVDQIATRLAKEDPPEDLRSHYIVVGDKYGQLVEVSDTFTWPQFVGHVLAHGGHAHYSNGKKVEPRSGESDDMFAKRVAALCNVMMTGDANTVDFANATHCPCLVFPKKLPDMIDCTPLPRHFHKDQTWRGFEQPRQG